MSLFCCMTIYYTIEWIDTESLWSICKIAICLALGMLSKTSAVLLAPAIGTVFLYRLWKGKNTKINYVKQYAIFGIVSIPLGMSWVIRNKIRFNIPFNFIHPLYSDNPQYVGDLPLISRIGLPSSYQMTGVELDIRDPAHYNNIWGQTVRTMLYDQGSIFLKGRFTEIMADTLTWCTYGIFAVLIICFLISIWKKSIPIEYRLLNTIANVTLFGSYVVFSFQSPFICTMNFRYIFCILVYLAVSFGWICSENGKFKILRIVGYGLIVLSSILGTVLYLVCAVMPVQ